MMTSVTGTLISIQSHVIFIRHELEMEVKCNLQQTSLGLHSVGDLITLAQHTGTWGSPRAEGQIKGFTTHRFQQSPCYMSVSLIGVDILFYFINLLLRLLQMSPIPSLYPLPIVCTFQLHFLHSRGTEMLFSAMAATALTLQIQLFNSWSKKDSNLSLS